MLTLPRWRVALCLLAFLFGLVFTLPNVLPQRVMDGLPGVFPHQHVNLGLDLQGGSHLLLQADVASLKTDRLNNLVEDVRKTLTDNQILFSGLAVSGSNVNVRITDPAQVQPAVQALQKLAQPIVGSAARDLLIGPGPDQTVSLHLQDQALSVLTAGAVKQDIEIVRRRIDKLGTKEPLIEQQGSDRIVVEAPGESDPEKLKSLIGQTAHLTFQMVDSTVSPEDIQAGRIPPDDQVLPSDEGGPMVVKRRAVVTGEMLTSAQPGFDQYNNPDINFRFNGVGAARFADVTSQNVGKRFAIVIDGKILSAPVIESAITGGSGEITGSFTAEAANDLAINLSSGALPVKLNVIEQTTVGAELGADSVRAGEIAGVIALALIAAFMILAYGFVFGGVAVGGLAVNMMMVLGAMSATGAALSLPGIAGLILTIAMAVDANVLIYERIRDEERAGRKPARAIEDGFRNATVSILDANITTLIAAVILFKFGAGPVRGFAWTLSIGVFTSVFTALFITRLLVVIWYRTTRDKRLPI
ncbi:MAG TPA: protein translocase subunit SecD [Caulobacteraceae bacterium]|nr:protein translocase subunit SecD [Caulobacteraceae bacterium]